MTEEITQAFSTSHLDRAVEPVGDDTEHITWRFPLGAKVRMVRKERPAPWDTVAWRIVGRMCKEMDFHAPIQQYCLALWEPAPGFALGSRVAPVGGDEIELWEVQAPEAA